MMKKVKKTIEASAKQAKLSDAQEEDWLMETAEQASTKAIRHSKALGLTVKFIENNAIVEVDPKGKRVLRRKSSGKPIDLAKLKKGMVLERK